MVLEITGSRVLGGDEKSFREEELRNLGFIPGGGTPLYRHQRAAVSIQDVEPLAVDRVPRSAPPSCFVSRKTMNEAVFGLGCGGWGVGPA
jgi:hypothetical protein